MTYYLISDREVVYNAVTLQSSSLVITPNMTNFNDPSPYVSGDSYVGINGNVYANYTEGEAGAIMVNSIHLEASSSQWDDFYNAQSFEVNTPFENVYLCSLKYMQAYMPEMFGLQPSEWTLVTVSVGL